VLISLAILLVMPIVGIADVVVTPTTSGANQCHRPPAGLS
jgi:hypothetical protein